jgi:hypothetical protein
MAENTDIKLTLEAWAEIVLDRWMDKIDRLGIGYSLQLEDSFRMEVINNAGGDVARIEFAFKYYGKFVDMGVGKGTKLDQVKELKTDRRLEGRQHGNYRQAKPWYGKTFYAERMKLMEILSAKYARKGALAIVENVDDNAEKWESRWGKV